jgi:hypothetical protein
MRLIGSSLLLPAMRRHTTCNECAAALRPRLHVIVVFTDGETPWPTEEPKGIDSIIVVLSHERALQEVPPWCSVITMDDA